jgi:superfamily II DNA/RNA helicase
LERPIGEFLTFEELGIDKDIVEALAEKGITSPFPIQEQAIPLALTGQDIIGQAKTGTGKTLGFGLPLIQSLGFEPSLGAKALVVVPTRELAIQVADDLKLATSKRPTQVAAIYGGKAYEGQIAEIDAGAQIIVGTPGRLIDLSKQKKLDLGNIRRDARPWLLARRREALCLHARWPPDNAFLGNHARCHREPCTSLPEPPGAHPRKRP